jgi:geranylgeranyl diphosphate synthase, type II
MSENVLSLIVPVERQLREEIRLKTDDFFILNETIPPVTYNRLTELADDLLERYGWERSYQAFVMVCIGNAIWRPVVGSIPFTRRMLLLPQCLKNSNLCQGRQDELGLLCSECGNCNISGFLRQAESLGYLTIVTEGTTIASGLVESGKVDAIIGVGCMEVLQKIFKAVNKYSVPAIGVPLLSCGCIDTTADAEWIKQEINYLDRKNEIRLLNLNDLKEKTKLLFTSQQIDKLLSLRESATDKILREILLAGGKRIRPLLAALTYEAFSTKPDTDILKHLAMSIECFHKASLVHDDIEDGDELRYGQETIHKKYGIPVAINTGDLLIGEGYRLISECNLKSDVKTECIRIISSGHTAMSVGQSIELLARRNKEILPVADTLEIFKNKTAAAFKVSLLTGAIAGNADEESLQLLDQFSYLIGIAYQLKDDLEDITDTRNDSTIRNPSAVISVLAEKAGADESAAIVQALNNNELGALTAMIEKHSVASHIDNMIMEHLLMINSCLGRIKNIPLKLALHEIVGKTFSKYL